MDAEVVMDAEEAGENGHVTRDFQSIHAHVFVVCVLGESA